jgi:hypothetical protein
MIPLLAPLLGSLAGSLLPATLGTGIAASLGLSGAAAGLVAAAAPKAIGAGIGTLLAGGDLGDAALNAVGFGAGGALLSGAGAAGAGATAAPAAAAAPITAAAPAPAIVPAASSEAATSALPNLARSASQIAQALGGGQQTQPTMSTAPISRPPQNSASDNPMLASFFQPSATSEGPMPARTSVPSTVPVSGGSSMMPAAVGIGSIPMQGQSPMSNDMMLAGMSPNQSDMVSQYLRSRNMVGFA